MEAIRQWDEAFLQEYAERAPRAAFDQQCADDWARAAQQVRRELSDTVHGWRECKVRRCRRARTCAGDASCVARMRVALPPDVEWNMVDEVYAELQEDRKIAVLGMAAVLKAEVPWEA
jgi:hypothetical protein